MRREEAAASASPQSPAATDNAPASDPEAPTAQAEADAAKLLPTSEEPRGQTP
jgi:hypothetical protein